MSRRQIRAQRRAKQAQHDPRRQQREEQQVSDAAWAALAQEQAQRVQRGLK